MNDRDETIKRIRTALYRRSGKQWNVTGGRGTAWGWITIDAPPKRRTAHSRIKAGATMNRPEDYETVNTGEPNGYMTVEDQAELATLLGLDKPQCWQGISVPSSSAHYQEFTERAEGRPVTKIAEAYWD
jgi:hypothetical protein